jgi:LSD1 subclass zinc finger protein
VKGFLQFIAKLRGAGSIYRCSQCKSHTMVQGGPRWL